MLRRRGLNLARMMMLMGGRGASAPIPWYLSGGIPAANCIAAYQPIGAASLALSYVNLANPGTYDATAPTAAPDHSTAEGWIFDSASSEYLSTGVPVNLMVGDGSLIIKYTDFTAGGYFVGASGCVLRKFIGTYSRYSNGGTNLQIDVAPNLLGTSAVAGNKAYRDGIAEPGDIPSGVISEIYPIFVNTYNNLGSPATFCTYKVQALAIYDITLTPAKVLAVHNAMEGL